MGGKLTFFTFLRAKRVIYLSFFIIIYFIYFSNHRRRIFHLLRRNLRRRWSMIFHWRCSVIHDTFVKSVAAHDNRTVCDEWTSVVATKSSTHAYRNTRWFLYQRAFAMPWNTLLFIIIIFFFILSFTGSSKAVARHVLFLLITKKAKDNLCLRLGVCRVIICSLSFMPKSAVQ